MTDQPKPDPRPDAQDAPKPDAPPKADAAEVTKPPAPPPPPAEAAKSDRPATLVEAAKPADSASAEPSNGAPDAAKAEGIVTRDLSNAQPPPAEKPAASSIPSPVPAKAESSGSAAPGAAPTQPETGSPAAPGEPKATQRLPDMEALGVPSSATSGGTVCPTCGHRNRPGVLLCENCGTNLMSGKQSGVGTRDLMREQEKGEGQLDAEAQRAVDTAGGGAFTEEMVLRIEIEGGSTPMLVYPKQEIIMGRRDPNTGGMPDVDLTAYAGYRMGVSRQHAAIRLQDKQLNVSDLGSSNGTFLNGTRLNAHRPYQLRDGDEVRLGQMVLRLYFQSNKDRK